MAAFPVRLREGSSTHRALTCAARAGAGGARDRFTGAGRAVRQLVRVARQGAADRPAQHGRRLSRRDPRARHRRRLLRPAGPRPVGVRRPRRVHDGDPRRRPPLELLRRDAGDRPRCASSSGCSSACRRRGSRALYLAIVTLGAGATCSPTLVLRFDWLTGGSNGKGPRARAGRAAPAVVDAVRRRRPPGPTAVGVLHPRGDRRRCCSCSPATSSSSRPGRALITMRDHEPARGASRRRRRRLQGAGVRRSARRTAGSPGRC